MRITFCLLICLTLCFLFNSISAQEADLKAFDTTMYGKNPAAGKYADLRGFKMYYETYGSGQPLLIIHGNGGSINNFLYQIPYFSQNYKVILADSRGHGKSVDNTIH